MSFTTATMNSGFPAKDFMAALGTQLTAAGYTFVESYATPGSANWPQIIYAGGQFVTVANSTLTAGTSPDGITWTQRSLPANVSWNQVAYGGGTYVALASSGPAYATSPDGITWTQRALPYAGNNTWYLAYGNGVFVAIATSLNVALVSADGITWAIRYLPASPSYVAITFGAGQFVALAANTASCYTSPDGVSWSTRALPSNTTWSAITCSGSMFVAVATGTTIAASSPDGITWTGRTLPATSNWASVTWGNNLFVAVASGTVAATSPDGITWTARTLPYSATWTSVAYGNGVFAVVSNNSSAAATLTSPDGITWTVRTLPATSAMPAADVWKSPAANNAFGQDWYLILRRTNDLSGQLFYQVAEGYNTGTHKASGYGGLAVTAVPTPGTYVNPLAAGTPDTVCAASAQITLPSMTPFTYWASVTGDRVVVGIKGTAEAGFYAGLYDDLLPAGTTGFPLACALIPNAQVSSVTLGSGTSSGTGGFTREPLQQQAVNTNFEARIHNGYDSNAGSARPGGFTPGTTANALYGNVGVVARVPIGSARTVPATNPWDAMRGLLIGCVCSSVLSVAGDTVTAGGKTYTRVAGPTSSYGIYVDQAL